MARVEHACRSCGAALAIPAEHERFFRCEYCGSVLEDRTPPEEKAQGRIVIELPSSTTEVDTATLETYGRGARLVGRLVSLFVLATIAATGFGIFQVVRSATDGVGGVKAADGSGLALLNHASGATLASDDSTAPDVITFARGRDGDRIVYVDFDDDPAVRWTADLGVDADVFAQFVPGGDLVVIATERQLFGLNRGSGAQAWRVELPDVVDANLCDGCLRVMGDTVVTLAKDGTLSGHELATGAARWSVTLNETPRQLVDFGGAAGALDEVDGTVVMQLHSVASGEVTGRLGISCRNPTFGSRQPIGIFDTVFPVGGGGLVHLGNPAFGPCAQRWDPPGTAPRWDVPYGRPDGAGIFSTDVIVEGELMVVVGADRVDAVDLTNGSVRAVAQLPDVDLLPVAAADGVVVVVAKSDRGSGSIELRAVDLAAGNVKWTFELPEAFAVPLARGVPELGSDHWFALPTGAGLAVLTVDEEAQQLQHRVIPYATGTASSPTTIELSGFAGTLSRAEVIGVAGDVVHLAIDQAVVALDAATGEVVGRIP